MTLKTVNKIFKPKLHFFPLKKTNKGQAKVSISKHFRDANPPNGTKRGHCFARFQLWGSHQR